MNSLLLAQFGFSCQSSPSSRIYSQKCQMVINIASWWKCKAKMLPWIWTVCVFTVAFVHQIRKKKRRWIKVSWINTFFHLDILKTCGSVSQRRTPSYSGYPFFFPHFTEFNMTWAGCFNEGILVHPFSILPNELLCRVVGGKRLCAAALLLLGLMKTALNWN